MLAHNIKPKRIRGCCWKLDARFFWQVGRGGPPWQWQNQKWYAKPWSCFLYHLATACEACHLSYQRTSPRVRFGLAERMRTTPTYTNRMIAYECTPTLVIMNKGHQHPLAGITAVPHGFMHCGSVKLGTHEEPLYGVSNAEYP